MGVSIRLIRRRLGRGQEMVYHAISLIRILRRRNGGRRNGEEEMEVVNFRMEGIVHQEKTPTATNTKTIQQI